MDLTHQERHWLKWFGATGKLAMRKACFLNRNRTRELEQTFERIAQTRVDLLNSWVANQWNFLEDAALYLSTRSEVVDDETLAKLLQRGRDFSELFVVNAKGTTLTSSYVGHKGQVNIAPKALQAGLVKRYLHGPYVDKATLEVGPSTSAFHDEVTLMFYVPFVINGDEAFCLCGRVPNDVVGDLIQREAGHIYSESGDNYIFMVDSQHDGRIAPGVALSRSRFEDSTFSHGENLKQGIRTDWGTVKIHRHTEFEIRFTDPATNELHPGVRETIKNGSNLYIEYPGYSDYRHIPVIGKGVTFQLDGSPDTFGMMCESDLEEVYRDRSVGYSLTKQFYASMIATLFLPFLAAQWMMLSPLLHVALMSLCMLISGSLFYRLSAKPLSQKMKQMTQVMQTLAEGDGNLSQRLDPATFSSDELGNLGRWTNSFIDHLDNIIRELIHASSEVKQVSESMFRRSQALSSASEATSGSLTHMLTLSQHQQDEITNANVSATQMDVVMKEAVESAEAEYLRATEGMNLVKDIVENSAISVNEVNSEMGKVSDIIDIITDITAQTNLLALNAAIEAARAGEHGRGFSVVATEVRTLADRTSSAAQHIGQIMQELHDKSQRAVKSMEQGVQNVSNGSLMVDSSERNQQMHDAVSELFGTISALDKNSADNRDSAAKAQTSVHQLQVSTQQLARRVTLMKNVLGRLEQLIGRFEVSRKTQFSAVR
ncbi:methyl-accepting chemotaxis protein [Vibrio sp. SM6]|uniref:Methyl-accepting chemotaxis protein n=1 Tax=Vibrio agarilyticus TaxID=2726741 RepID=A0A7X8TRR8_9VIBR|nr:methyl-accepting chemotaxis protein [Vibrio agarilyticus]NLS13003.1 methyl-accepting chemotaxis protein [Vibrio agarilyticus]